MKRCLFVVVLTAALVGLLAFPALASVSGSQAWAAPLRVAEVSLDPSVISPNGDGVADRATLTYSVSARCRARVLVRSGPGIVRELQRWSTTKRGQQTTIWDGRDSKRNAVRTGRYTIEVYVTDLSGRRARPYPLKVFVDVAASPFIVQGTLMRDAVWSGDILVADTVVVAPRVTLTVEPGTRVMFRATRSYRSAEPRCSLMVEGRILAEGSAERPIYFTSVDTIPCNGDWSMVRLLAPDAPCVFSYAVFEYAQQGLNVWRGTVDLSHCLFRWNNWEGVYFESNSIGRLDHCQLVENGYNGLAAEQFNTITMDECEVWRSGTNGVHVDATDLEIRRSLVHDNGANGLSVDDNATLRAYGVSIRDNRAFGIGFGQGDNSVQVSNVDFAGNAHGDTAVPVVSVVTTYFPPAAIDLGFAADWSHPLGYVPGDPLLDRYQYVYPDDETRRVVRRIGLGLGLTWSVAWDGEHIWTASIGTGQIYELDPVTGTVLKEFPAPGPQPWGMTWDGTYLWVVDFAEKRISKVDPRTGEELATFATPDPKSGCKGVTWDGAYLNVMGWSTPTVYRMDRGGSVKATIELDEGAAGGIAWDGTSFWVPGARIYKFDVEGHVVGWIYPASEGTWDLTWDGRYLWACQRTNENWWDAKLFALEVLEVKSAR